MKGGTESKRNKYTTERMSVGICPRCGKQQYATKKAAKFVMRTRHPGDQMYIYKCGDFFHLAHKTYPAKRGIKSRDQVRNTRAEEYQRDRND